jgi:hypothetical protein
VAFQKQSDQRGQLAMVGTFDLPSYICSSVNVEFQYLLSESLLVLAAYSSRTMRPAPILQPKKNCLAAMKKFQE